MSFDINVQVGASQAIAELKKLVSELSAVDSKARSIDTKIKIGVDDSALTSAYGKATSTHTSFLSHITGNKAVVGLDGSGFLSGLRGLESSFGGFISRIGAAAATAGVALGGAMAVGLGLATKAYADFEQGAADLNKVMGGTSEEQQTVSDGLRQLSIESGTAVTSLQGVAGSLSSLGVASGEVVQATKVIDQMGIALGLANDEGANYMSGMRSLYGTAVDKWSNLASGINEVENSTAATSKGMLNFANEFAPIAKMMGVTDKEALALGATFEALKLEPGEAAASVRSAIAYAQSGPDQKLSDEVKAKIEDQTYEYKVQLKASGIKGDELTKQVNNYKDSLTAAANSEMGTGNERMTKWAQLLGTDVKTLNTMLDSDLNGTLLKTGAALSQITSGTERTKTTMEIFGEYGTKSLALLGDQSAAYYSNLETLNKGYEENVSIAREVETRNNTLYGSWNRAKASVVDLGIDIGKATSGPLKNLLDYFTDIQPKVKEFSNALISGDFSKASAAFGDVFSGVSAKITESLSGIGATITSLPWSDWGNSAVNMLASAAAAAFNATFDLMGWLSSKLTSAQTSFYDFGRTLGQKIVDGVKWLAEPGEGGVPRLLEFLWQAIQLQAGLLNAAAELGLGIGSAIVDSLAPARNSFLEWLQALDTGVTNFGISIENIFRSAVNAGQGVLKSFVETWNSTISALSGTPVPTAPAATPQTLKLSETAADRKITLTVDASGTVVGQTGLAKDYSKWKEQEALADLASKSPELVTTASETGGYSALIRAYNANPNAFNLNGVSAANAPTYTVDRSMYGDYDLEGADKSNTLPQSERDANYESDVNTQVNGILSDTRSNLKSLYINYSPEDLTLKDPVTKGLMYDTLEGLKVPISDGAKDIEDAGESVKSDFSQMMRQSSGAWSTWDGKIAASASNAGQTLVDGATQAADIEKQKANDIAAAQQAANDALISRGFTQADIAYRTLQTGAQVSSEIIQGGAQAVVMKWDEGLGKFVAVIGSIGEDVKAAGGAFQVDTSTAGQNFIAYAGQAGSALLQGAQSAANALSATATNIGKIMASTPERTLQGGSSVVPSSTSSSSSSSTATTTAPKTSGLSGWGGTPKGWTGSTFATGTKTSGAQLAVIGEDGASYPEYVIPTKTKRWDLLNALMHDYGVPGYADGVVINGQRTQWESDQFGEEGYSIIVTGPDSGYQSTAKRGLVGVDYAEDMPRNFLGESIVDITGANKTIQELQAANSGKSSVMPSEGVLNPMAYTYSTESATTANEKYADVTDEAFKAKLQENDSVVAMTAENGKYCEGMSDMGIAIEEAHRNADYNAYFYKTIIGQTKDYEEKKAYYARLDADASKSTASSVLALGNEARKASIGLGSVYSGAKEVATGYTTLSGLIAKGVTNLSGVTSSTGSTDIGTSAARSATRKYVDRLDNTQSEVDQWLGVCWDILSPFGQWQESPAGRAMFNDAYIGPTRYYSDFMKTGALPEDTSEIWVAGMAGGYDPAYQSAATGNYGDIAKSTKEQYSFAAGPYKEGRGKGTIPQAAYDLGIVIQKGNDATEGQLSKLNNSSARQVAYAQQGNTISRNISITGQGTYNSVKATETSTTRILGNSEDTKLTIKSIDTKADIPLSSIPVQTAISFGYVLAGLGGLIGGSGGMAGGWNSLGYYNGSTSPADIAASVSNSVASINSNLAILAAGGGGSAPGSFGGTSSVSGGGASVGTQSSYSGWGATASSGQTGNFGGSQGYGSVTWGAKGLVVDEPTIVGLGEAGRELAAPIPVLEDIMHQAVRNASIQAQEWHGTGAHSMVNSRVVDLASLRSAAPQTNVGDIVLSITQDMDAATWKARADEFARKILSAVESQTSKNWMTYQNEIFNRIMAKVAKS